MPAIPITGINHVALWVRDLKKSVAWYKEVLGLTESHGDERHVFIQVGDQVLALFQAAEKQEINSPHHIALSVEGQPAQAEKTLCDQGIEMNGGRFRDPDGHVIHFA